MDLTVYIARIFGSILILAKVEFKVEIAIIVAKWVETFAKWVKSATTAMLMPLMVIMAATALRVQWIFAGIKSTKI
jgi:hypothetical protein